MTTAMLLADLDSDTVEFLPNFDASVVSASEGSASLAAYVCTVSEVNPVPPVRRWSRLCYPPGCPTCW